MISPEPISPYFSSCRLCPRNCGVNRSQGERGFCGETDRLRLAVAGLHFGEEPPLTGSGGSGTVFVTGCALRCPFCQNWQVSRCGMGREVDVDEFLEIVRSLKEAGAENLNLVTPSHMAPTLALYLDAMKGQYPDFPVAWNSSGYESPQAVEIVAPYVDFWLVDLKTLSPELAADRYGVSDYPQTVRRALEVMLESKTLAFQDDRRKLKSGTVIRHLVLPGELDSTFDILDYFTDHLVGRAVLSLMTQYTPVRVPGESRAIPERVLSEEEYQAVLFAMDQAGIEDGFYQELVTGDDWLPDFRKGNPFGSELSRIVWHWEEGWNKA